MNKSCISQKMILILSILFTAQISQAQDTLILRGQTELKPYKQALMQALQTGMLEGPVSAIDACHLEAPAIKENLSAGNIRVGRASHKLRNPENTAPAWVQPILNAYIANPADRQAQAITLIDGRTGYVEPILLQPLCTSCHGENVSEAVLAKIHTLYPDDQATGFRVGELRGVFWAELPE